MPTIHIEEIKTSLLTLFGVSLVLWRRNADSVLSNPYFMTLPLTSQTSEFPIFNLLQLLKFLLEVVAIGRKKCREGSRHYPCRKFPRKFSKNGAIGQSGDRKKMVNKKSYLSKT
jgi:hypothetical protein